MFKIPFALDARNQRFNIYWSSVFEMKHLHYNIYIYIITYVQGVPKKTHVLGIWDITPLWKGLGTKVCFEKFRKFSLR